MANYNKIILLGNITRDPNLKDMGVCEFGLAVNRKWRDKNGNQKEEVCFVDCQAWGKTGEVIAQYCTKGSPILVEGRLCFSQWTGQNGDKRSKHTVTVDTFQFLAQQAAGSPEADDEIPF